MTEPYLGEIQIFGFNFAPREWALCNGATLSIQQNASLFSLIGTQYGGNGTSSFMLPNLVNRAACSQGTGPGLTQRVMGESFGENSETLVVTEMPMHTHQMIGHQGPAANRVGTPAADYALGSPRAAMVFATGVANTTLAPQTVTSIGGNQPHENRQPFLALTFCVSLAGNFPAFN